MCTADVVTCSVGISVRIPTAQRKVSDISGHAGLLDGHTDGYTDGYTRIMLVQLFPRAMLLL